MSALASLNLTTATAEHPRDKLARMIALVRERRAATGATQRTANAWEHYRQRASLAAMRAYSHKHKRPAMVASLARLARIVAPECGDKRANESIARMVEARDAIRAVQGASMPTIASVLSRLAAKGTDAGAPSRLAVTVPAGLSLPDWIPAEGGTWYHVPHLAPGRYQYTTRTVANLEAWVEALAVRERERALPSPVIRRPSLHNQRADRIALQKTDADDTGTAAAECIDAIARAGEALAQAETDARNANDPKQARAAWEKANRIARLMAKARDDARTLATRSDDQRTEAIEATWYGAPHYTPAPVQAPMREGWGGVRVYAPQVA